MVVRVPLQPGQRRRSRPGRHPVRLGGPFVRFIGLVQHGQVGPGGNQAGMRVCVDHSRHHEPVLQVHEPGVLGGVLQSFLVRPHEDDSVTLRDQRLRPRADLHPGYRFDRSRTPSRLRRLAPATHRLAGPSNRLSTREQPTRAPRRSCSSSTCPPCNPRQPRGSRRPSCRIHPSHHHLRRQATVGCAARLPPVCGVTARRPAA